MLTWLKRHLRTLLLTTAGLSVLPSYLWSYSITGASEAPTVLKGDTIIVNRAAYDFRLPYSRLTLFHTGSPRRGDMVLAHLPDGRSAIKRILALPQEIIEVRENRVIVNGRPLPVQLLDRAAFAWVPATNGMGSTVVMEDGHWAAYTPGKSDVRNHAPVRLGADEYFLIGDNRDNSLDSRDFGPVSRGRILGKMIAVIPVGPRVAGD